MIEVKCGDCGKTVYYSKYLDRHLDKDELTAEQKSDLKALGAIGDAQYSYHVCEKKK